MGATGRVVRVALAAAVGLGLALTAARLFSRGSPEVSIPSASVVDALAAPNFAAGFQQVLQPRELLFPEDHGSHPKYRTEWWYYTGNLVQAGDGSADPRRFGYQLTFFRRALTADAATRTSAWATNDIYMAHFAVTDVADDQLRAHERWARGAAGLAGAETGPHRVWLEDWSATTVAGDSVRLSAREGPVAIDLELTPEKRPALHGDSGYSPKGPEPGNASYYYSYTRLATVGTVTIDGQAHAVDGLSWMDHEWSTSALSRDQVGWDWYSMQLDDGRELMLYHIRAANGDVAEASSGSLIGTDGRVTALARDDFDVTVLGSWRSPTSGATYPSGWQVEIPGADEILTVRPFVDDQEMNLRYRYWEGAVEITGTAGGVGYVELTGY